MKILVTGAGGFVGNHLSHKLKDLGHEVLVIDFSNKVFNCLTEFDVFDFDLSEYEHFSRLPKDIDVIYLLINEKPFAKFNDFYDSESPTDFDQSINKINWTFALLKSYLPEGCMQISFAGMINNELFVLDNQMEICTTLD